VGCAEDGLPHAAGLILSTATDVGRVHSSASEELLQEYLVSYVDACQRSKSRLTRSAERSANQVGVIHTKPDYSRLSSGATAVHPSSRNT
jgi:hypothetical protein